MPAECPQSSSVSVDHNPDHPFGAAASGRPGGDSICRTPPLPLILCRSHICRSYKNGRISVSQPVDEVCNALTPWVDQGFGGLPEWRWVGRGIGKAIWW